MKSFSALRCVAWWWTAASLLAASPEVGSPLSFPLLFVESDARLGGACRWQAQGFDYSVCIAERRVHLVHEGRGLSWEYVGGGALLAEPEGLSVSTVNEFRGATPEQWRTGVPAFSALRVRALYPGIDLVLSGDGGRLKADYVVAPFADPARVRLRFPDALSVRSGTHGGLIIGTASGDWREDAPVLYQPGPEPVAVSGRALVFPDGTAGFEVGSYDHALPLVIDPVLSFSTLVGVSGTNALRAMALGPGGEIVLAGYTDSVEFPSVQPQRGFASGVEAVLVKLAADGSSILQSTFLGGSGDDRAFAVAVDPEGGIYVAGWTTSTNFPTANAFRTARAGARDAFLARLAPSGTSLSFSTYLGGSGEDHAAALIADAAGVWVAGDTNSTDFPLLGALRSTPGGQQDGFLSRFSAAGALQSSTYVGGSGDETLRALAPAASNGVYVAGGSTSTDLPVPANGWRPNRGGGQDGFVLRLNSAGSAVTGGTWLGGTLGGVGMTELVQSLAVAPDGELIAGGSTPSADFPVLHPWAPVHRGTSMGFVTRLKPDLASASWSTFAGGMNSDRVEAVAADAQGRVYAAGRTFSLDLPLAAALQAAYGGEGDAFLLVLSADGGTLVFGTYLGGAASDAATALAITPGGKAVVGGVSLSLDYPSVGSLSTPTQTATRFFVSIINMAFHAPELLSVAPASGSGEQVQLEVRLRDADGASDIRTVLVLIHSSFVSSGACYISAEPGPGLVSLAADNGAQWTSAVAGGAGVLSNSQCQVRASGSGFQLNGNELRLTLDLTFEAGFGGLRQIHVLGADSAQLSSGWAQLGIFTVTTGGAAAPPVVASIHPASAAGLRQTFTLTVKDPQGGSDLHQAGLLAAPAFGLSSVCRVRWSASPAQIQLANDAGTGWSSATPGASVVLENSQCRLHAVSSGINTGGAAALAWVDLEFRPAWTGTRRLWGEATDIGGLAAPWTELGLFEVTDAPNRPPVLESLTAPQGTSGIFTITASDPDGAGSLRQLHLLVGSAPYSSSACLVVFDSAADSIALHPDEVGMPWPVLAPGHSGFVENTRCRLRGAGSSFSATGAQATYRIDLEFKPGFGGLKPVRAHVLDAAGAMSPQFQVLERLNLP